VETNSVNLYNVTKAWTESAVTQNNTGESVGSVQATTNFPTGSNLWITFNIPAALVQLWINNPATNFGVQVRSAGETHISPYPLKKNFLRFDSAQSLTLSQRPKLTINYTPNGNIKPKACLTIDPKLVIDPLAQPTITADASDPDGTVTNVQLYVDGVLKGTDTTSPYAFSGYNMTLGDHDVYVLATDNSGATKSSTTNRILCARTIYSANMDVAPAGWTLEDAWAHGTPSGVDTAGLDDFGEPAAGYTGTKILGYRLASPYYIGAYSSGYATTVAINCAGYTNVALRFHAWLGIWGSGYGDHADIEVSTNGTTWATVWASSSGDPNGCWTERRYNISAWANNQPTVYVRWRMEAGQYGSQYAHVGWNIDDFYVYGEPSFDLAKPFIAVQGVQVNAGDGFVVPGESIQLVGHLKNNGAVPVTNLTSTLSSTNVYCSVTQSNWAPGTVNSGVVVSNPAAPYAVTISPSVPLGTVLPFRLNLAGNGGYATNYSFTVSVSKPELSLYGVVVNAGDGFVEPGEGIQLICQLQNNGGPATNLTATLSSTNAYCSVTQSNWAPGSVAAGAIVSNQAAPYAVTISPSAPQGASLPFKLTLSGGWGYTTNLSFTVSVSKPDVSLNAVVVNDGDGFIEPGEGIQLICQLQNNGGPATNLSATLSSTNAYCSVTQSNWVPGTVAAGAIVSNQAAPYAVTVSPSAPQGASLPFKLSVSGGWGYATNYSFTVSVSKSQLSLYSVVVNDINGNANLALNPNERAQMLVGLTNSGLAVTGVVATLSCSDPKISLVCSNAAYGTINKLAQKINSSAPFCIQTASNALVNGVYPFTLSVAYNGNSSTSFAFEVASDLAPSVSGTSSWINTSGGTTLALGDETSSTVGIGFAFPYYGQTYTQISVVGNGYLDIPTIDAVAYNNTTLPNAVTPNGVIAPYWDDLDPGSGGTINTLLTGSAPNRIFVVSWNGVPLYGAAGSSVMCQALLHESGKIVFQYGAMTGTSYGASATIGIESPDASKGVQYSFNQANAVSNGTSITFDIANPADSDGDGVPNALESIYGFSSTSMVASADTDGDGQSNLNELYSGTNPYDSNSVLKVLGATPNTGLTNCVVSWQSVPGQLYRIYTTTNLSGTWSNRTPSAVVGGNTGSNQYTVNVSATNSPLFLRISTPE
jgi:hypothetical protein